MVAARAHARRTPGATMGLLLGAALLDCACGLSLGGTENYMVNNPEFQDCLNATSPPCVELDLAFQLLTGPVPTEIGLLTQLTRLDLSFNSFSNNLPTEIGLMTRMRVLGIVQTTTFGRIPTQLGDLHILRELYLNQNSLIGTLPTEIGKLNLLQHAEFGQNALVGSIPDEFANLQSCTYFNVRDQRATATAFMCGPKKEDFIVGMPENENYPELTDDPIIYCLTTPSPPPPPVAEEDPEEPTDDSVQQRIEDVNAVWRTALYVAVPVAFILPICMFGCYYVISRRKKIACIARMLGVQQETAEPTMGVASGPGSLKSGSVNRA